MPSRSSLHFTARLPASTAVRFADMCERRGVARSAMLLELVEKALITDDWVVAALGPYYGLDEDGLMKGEPIP